MVSWSNPNPEQGVNGAEMRSRSMVNAPDIGHIVSAILQDRYRKQQQFQETMAQAGKVVGDIRGQQDAGALADYMQGNQAALSQMSPAGQLKALEYKRKQEDDALNTRLIEAKIGELGQRHTDPVHDPNTPTPNWLAEHDPSSPYYVPPTSKPPTPGQIGTANRDVMDRTVKDLKEQFATGPYGFKKTATGYFNANGEWVKDSAGTQEMIGDPIRPHPRQEHWLREDTPAYNESYSNVFPREEAERGKSAADRYMELSRTGGLPAQSPTGQAPPPAQGGITKEQYDALPSGATYTAPDGSQRRKP